MIFLRELWLRNLLSFGPDTPAFELRALNVLIGPNGSGKSNVIEAIGLLAATPKDMVGVVREGGTVREWIWKGATRGAAARLEVSVEYPGGRGPLRHWIEFVDAAARFEITDERNENDFDIPGEAQRYFYFGNQQGRPMLNVKQARRELRKEQVDPQRSILAQRKDPDQYPEITYLGEQYQRVRSYREWSYGRATPPRIPQPADLPNGHLEEDARNLGLVLNRLRRSMATKRRLLEELAELYAGIEDFDIQIEGGTVQIFLQEREWIVPATRLSDGTLRYLALLAVLVDPEPPPLVCIEEPEMGLHPDLMPRLARLLVEASSRTQLVVTTHSDILVDALTETPEDVVVVEKQQGATTLNRLDSIQLASWLEHYRLGELWIRGELGGSRW